ncbi:MAG: phage major capsid protein [Corynebacterium sp.]|uniref:phage major capsid protein n=1 Tax=Corynebacterium sp. TaxID=1720 RepID=UPI0026DAE26D|nr:phage major capsid protein [Corynebacterium sp.]MDO5030424.1 phage major capsid protein [Corynebacterium sp.]
MLNTTNSVPVLTPEQVQQLLVKPVIDQSIAAQVSTVVITSSKTTRFPMLTKDPVAAWTAEGAEITPSDPEFAELEVTPTKVAGLVIATNEMMRDSSAEAVNQIGEGLVRDITRAIDAAFFGALDAPAPQGLNTIEATEINGNTANLDWAEEAIAAAANNGATVTGFVANPADILTLAKLKESKDSNRGLLEPNPTVPTGRLVAGVPLHSTTAVPQGTVWAIPNAFSNVVVRESATVVASTEQFFTSDRTAVRGTMRVGFGFTHPTGIVKVTLTAA